MTETQTKPFYILSLDGGGSLGVYTLGVLERVEALVEKTLSAHFDLIYGTSTGSIIGCLLSLGYNVEEILNIYFKYIPNIMTFWRSSRRSEALKRCADDIFGNQQFDELNFKTLTGVVATHSDNNPRPLIFKSSERLFMAGQRGDKPGFGCTISDVVVASCSATPLFDRHKITTGNIRGINSFDGGFVANNPTLFAITDAIKALNIPEQKIKVLNVGVGSYPRSHTGYKERILSLLASSSLELFEDTLAANSNTIDTLRKIVFPNVDVIRISESTNDSEYKTNLIESNREKLKRIKNFGRGYSYDFQKQKIQQLLTKKQ